MKIIFIGLPGCGKTTQAKRLSEHLGISYISMRQLVQESNLIKSDSWQPLSDKNAIALCQQAIADKSEFILDGFPRNKQQYQGLNIENSVVIVLDIRFEESKKRMLMRGDNRKNVETRINLEKQRFPELINNIPHYRWDGGLVDYLIKIDGNCSKDEVSNQIINHPIIWFLSLSEEIKNKLLYLYDPSDGCFGSIFNINNPELAINFLRKEIENEF